MLLRNIFVTSVTHGDKEKEDKFMGLNDMLNSAKDYVAENGDDLLNKAKDFAENNEEIVEKAKDTAESAVDSVKNKFGL